MSLYVSDPVLDGFFIPARAHFSKMPAWLFDTRACSFLLLLRRDVCIKEGTKTVSDAYLASFNVVRWTVGSGQMRAKKINSLPYLRQIVTCAK